MKTPFLDDGDLVVGTNSDLQMVTGVNKVAQDVRGALLEPIGNDRFHPGWGSDLDSYIGNPAYVDVTTTVQSEVNRVVGNLAAVQRDQVESQSLNSQISTWTTSEVISGVTSVNVSQTYDTVNVEITIGTVSGETTTIAESGV